MGYYIQTDDYTGKAKYIKEKFNGRIVDYETAKEAVDKFGVIIVVNNFTFEAAAFAYDIDEFNAFHDLDDDRPKTYVIIDREIAKKESGAKNID